MIGVYHIREKCIILSSMPVEGNIRIVKDSTRVDHVPVSVSQGGFEVLDQFEPKLITVFVNGSNTLATILFDQLEDLEVIKFTTEKDGSKTIVDTSNPVQLREGEEIHIVRKNSMGGMTIDAWLLLDPTFDGRGDDDDPTPTNDDWYPPTNLLAIPQKELVYAQLYLIPSVT